MCLKIDNSLMPFDDPWKQKLIIPEQIPLGLAEQVTILIAHDMGTYSPACLKFGKKALLGESFKP